MEADRRRDRADGRVQRAEMASAGVVSDGDGLLSGNLVSILFLDLLSRVRVRLFFYSYMPGWPDSSSPLSALDSASPSDPHATKLAPSPASHYSIESLIRTSGECESLLLTICSVN